LFKLAPIAAPAFAAPDARLCMLLPTPPSAPVAPANAPRASLARSPAAAVKPFNPVPIPPLNWLIFLSRFDFNESNFPLDEAIAPDAESAAALTCSETLATNVAKGLAGLDILVIFPYYTLFILDKMCYYINYWRILKQ
jgi:hypothetical protein